MTWFIKALHWGRHGQSISVQEAGRRGAAVTNAKRREPILRRAIQMRDELGMPFDSRLAG